MEPYAKSRLFDQDSLPSALRANHHTREGTWGIVRVIEGAVRLTFDDPRREMIVTPERSAIVRPLEVHHATPQGRMKMRVEFYHSPPGEDLLGPRSEYS